MEKKNGGNGVLPPEKIGHIERPKPHESKNEIIETFKNRFLMKSSELSLKMSQKIVGSKPKKQEYLGQNYDNSSFKNGIFDFSQEKQLDLWNNAFDNCAKTELTDQEKNSKIMKFFFNNSFPNKLKIYKLFVYNDSEWKINDEEFNSFKDFLSSYQVKKQLVLLFDSSELESLYSNLAYQYNPFEEDELDQIFVYALYGKPFELVKRILVKNIESFNPIYLLLHVPNICFKPKLNTIIYRIYFFTYICF